MKQANVTSKVLMDLLSDEDITRQVTLQNRAAIDYLLLLHNHHCEEFEGLCCFNLSSRAEDIHQSISKIKDLVGEDWLGGLFRDWGLSGWAGSILKMGLLVLFVIIIFCIGLGVVKRMLSKLISGTTPPPTINMA